MPQKWGNVSGFHNLRLPEIKKYNWYPVADYSITKSDDEEYALVFLPEKEIVIKTGSQGERSLREYATNVLKTRLQYKLYATYIRVKVKGEVYGFPNELVDQLDRLTCLQLGKEYVCTARNAFNRMELITVSPEELRDILDTADEKYKTLMINFHTSLQKLQDADHNTLRVFIDTDFVDLYDE